MHTLSDTLWYPSLVLCTHVHVDLGAYLLVYPYCFVYDSFKRFPDKMKGLNRVNRKLCMLFSWILIAFKWTIYEDFIIMGMAWPSFLLCIRLFRGHFLTVGLLSFLFIILEKKGRPKLVKNGQKTAIFQCRTFTARIHPGWPKYEYRYRQVLGPLSTFWFSPTLPLKGLIINDWGGRSRKKYLMPLLWGKKFWWSFSRKTKNWWLFSRKKKCSKGHFSSGPPRSLMVDH